MVKSSVFTACALVALCAANVATADDSKPAAPKDAAHHTCLHDTGTLIKLKPGECSTSPSRSYSKDDMDRTGKVTAGGSLRMLDPSLTIR